MPHFASGDPKPLWCGSSTISDASAYMFFPSAFQLRYYFRPREPETKTRDEWHRKRKEDSSFPPSPFLFAASVPLLLVFPFLIPSKPPKKGRASFPVVSPYMLGTRKWDHVEEMHRFRFRKADRVHSPGLMNPSILKATRITMYFLKQCGEGRVFCIRHAALLFLVGRPISGTALFPVLPGVICPIHK